MKINKEMGEVRITQYRITYEGYSMLVDEFRETDYVYDENDDEFQYDDLPQYIQDGLWDLMYEVEFE